MKRRLHIAIVIVSMSAIVFTQTTPKAVADDLLAADRAFAVAAAGNDLATALARMFAPEIAMTHAGGIAYGSAAAIEALKSNPINAGAKITWTPMRVSVSGDGRHGFTAGVMTMTRADGGTTPLKYLAYWEKQADGWRVLAYKRGVSKTPAPAVEPTYVLPKQIAPAAADAATIERYREGLADVERAFSRDAQTMGIGAAFTQYGHPEAINLGGPDVPTFVIGNQQIGASVGSGSPPNTSPVHWGPERTIVSASGDFGVTIGYIVRNAPGADGKIPPGQPFFTIWKRDSTTERWLYIAE